MKFSAINFPQAFLRRRTLGILAALVATVAVGGELTRSATSSTEAPEGLNVTARPALDEIKPSLIGSYEVTGTEPDGSPYAKSSILDIALTPSGALELEWDNGRHVGIGQVIGNVLVVASQFRGRTVILVMNINPDGSLSGRSLRRTDRGSKGTEIWKRI